MQAAPQILLSTRLYKEQPVVFIGFLFRRDIVERMKKISGAGYISENIFKNTKNPIDDIDLDDDS